MNELQTQSYETIVDCKNTICKYTEKFVEQFSRSCQ